MAISHLPELGHRWFSVIQTSPIGGSTDHKVWPECDICAVRLKLGSCHLIAVQHGKFPVPLALAFLLPEQRQYQDLGGLEMVQGWKKSFFINYFHFYSLTVLHMTIIYPHYSLLSSLTPTKAFILPNKSPFTFIPLHMYMCVHVQMCACVYV